MFYLDLFRGLHKHDVRYLLCGGLAMNLYGVPRMTMDIDLVLALDDRNLDAFIACAEALDLKPQAPVPLASLKDPEQRRSWVEEKHLIAFGLSGAPGTPTVDVLLKHSLDIDAAIARAVIRDVDGIPVPLASIGDMVALKANTGRRQDQDDLEHLKRLAD
jgi:hypothetical protein